MKKIKGYSNLKKSLFLTLMMIATAMSWGQVNLEDCTITINNNVAYLYTGTPITSIAYVVNNGTTPITEGYNVSYKDSEDNDVTIGDGIGVGKYTLTITGNDALHTGTKSKNFYVLNASGSNYTIASEADWSLLANSCSDGYSYSSKTVKLTSDIVVGTKDGEVVTRSGLMVGSLDNPFTGTFDGYQNDSDKFHKLTFYYNEAGEDGVPVAPFQYTNNAIIKNLKVDGEIHKHIYGAAGLIGHNTGASTKVNDVLVEMFIDKYYDGDEVWTYRSGGFAVDGSGVGFENCVYRGKLLTVIDDRNGGFCGLGSDKTSFKNCLFDPDPTTDLNGVIFANGGVDYNHDHYATDEVIGKVFDSYYTFDPNNYYSSNGYAQGTFAYRNTESIENGNIGHKVTITTNNVGGFDVYEPVTVKLANDIYFYNDGNAITIDYTVTYDGETVVKGTDFTTSITDSYDYPVEEEDFKSVGVYTLTINNIKSDYYGFTTKSLRVVPTDAGWTNLQTLIDDAAENSEIYLDKDYYGSNSDNLPIIINKNLTINLNGYTIDRNLSEATQDGQVIRINSGKTVSITGPGIITGAWNKAKNTTSGSADNDGGGIYNKGNLTLNKVTVSNNHCEKKAQGTSATARGGGIYSGKNSSLTLINVNIRENTAQGGGGGVFADEATTFVVKDNSVIRSNVSADKGGGIRVKNCGTAEIISSQINSNTVNNATKESVANGGGIYCESGNVTIKNCEINNNIASKFGGGIYIQSGTVYAKDCTINKNQSYDENRLFNSRGGGVYIYSNTSTFIMSGGTIYGNSSNLAYGGGVFVNNGATFKVKGNVDINGNWRFYNAAGSYETTNVYITGKTSDDVITIDGTLGTSKIGIAKNGGGVFTNGLSGNGDESNFTSDDKSYEIQSSGTELAFGTPSPWVPSGDEDPLNPGEYIINSTVIIDDEYTGINKITFGDDGKIIIIEDGYLETNIINDDVNKVMIYGGQLKVPENSVVKATMRKDIHYAEALSKTNWYLISSGIANPGLVSNTNLLRVADSFPEYDLYRFNEAAELQWENYRAGHADFTTLQNGRGYLYRNANDYTINIRGTLNTSAVDYTLSYTETVNSEDNKVIGFNIIGNPYSFNVYKGAVGSAIPNGTLLETNYYVLNQSTGVFTLENDGTAIPPLAGILVQAKKQDNADDYILHMAYSQEGYVAPSSKSDRENIWFTIGNDKFEDKSCVEFRKGHGLNKIPHLNENAPMLYINHNGEDFASVDMNPDAKAFNLSFESKTTSKYTLNMDANGNYNYIHVYDKVTGRDIDMLNDEEYTFIGSPMDRKDRFEVRLNETAGTNSNDNTTFAYQSGDDILVSGDGELQIFDVMGRLVAQQHINGVEMVAKPSTIGVYIFRLNEQTQKMVVR